MYVYELKMYEIKAVIFMDAELNLISVIYSIFQVHNNASQPSQRASHNLVSVRQSDEQKQTNKQTQSTSIWIIEDSSKTISKCIVSLIVDFFPDLPFSAEAARNTPHSGTLCINLRFVDARTNRNISAVEGIRPMVYWWSVIEIFINKIKINNHKISR